MIDPGYPRRKYGSRLIFPDPLPDIPEVVQDLKIETGELVTVDGIFEPQVKNGSMNYLIKDAKAPLLGGEGGMRRAVVWKLILEDVRYRDGQIPAEERMYFQPESAPQVPQSAVTSDVVSKLSGDACTLDGYWAVMDEIDTKIALRKGMKMPQSRGRDFTWVWVGKWRMRCRKLQSFNGCNHDLPKPFLAGNWIDDCRTARAGGAARIGQRNRECVDQR